MDIPRSHHGIRLLHQQRHANFVEEYDPSAQPISSRKLMAPDSDAFECEINGDILLVTPVHDFSSARDNDLRDAYNEMYRQLMAGSARHLIIDFSHVSYFGSTFVGMMSRLAKRAADSGGRTVLCHLNDDARSILKQLMLLENSKADFFWKPAETREIAIQSLQSDAVGQQD